MTKEEYFDMLKDCVIDKDTIDKVQEKYGTDLPGCVHRILSCAKEPVFLDNVRILSIDEIMDAEEDLSVDFMGKQIIPIADVGDNDFVVYHFDDGTWSLFNIVDEFDFMKRSSFIEYLV